ncbi:GNAT family N-acetyltransferase (plasmid) [Pseudorhodobacter turbinis]|uniref:GNAT family N-acetyltransferase n=1 Tax=Pseudorhodobacter turbinis TaxID=2500533 RepID=A0A4P8EJ85_9RHOB|nr:GNAT family N-acetyltransferase [Pseudorhodobacter turbinis]QCO56765.1 GNAT family N-acetyltransferase [Pseudorhodobacter turbinis]
MTLFIRDIAPEDETLWRKLWAEYLAFYAVTLAPEVTDQTWARLVDPQAVLRGRVAVLDGAVMGFALHHHHMSTWAAAPDCYLEDLFLTDAARGHGIGRALMDDLIKICHENGYSRLYWHTDEGNARARKLYDSYTAYDGHVRYRIKL